MTKKEFLDRSSFHNYGTRRETSRKALFLDWKEGEIGEKFFRGFKYCVWGRGVNVTKKELVDTLYNFNEGKIKINDVPWYMDLVVSPTDEQRFKVPIVASGLDKLVKEIR